MKAPCHHRPPAGFTTNPTILKRDGVTCNIASMRQLAREVGAAAWCATGWVGGGCEDGLMCMPDVALPVSQHQRQLSWPGHHTAALNLCTPHVHSC